MKLVPVFVSLAITPLVACVYLPTAGPRTAEVIDQSVQENQIRYDVVDVSANVVSALLAQPEQSFRKRFAKDGRPPAPRIGVGDTVTVSIWEASGGGLFGTSTTGAAAGSRTVTIPDQVVGYDGAISVPFAGRVPVAGRSTLDVQHEIERRLAEKAIEPQVPVTTTRSVTNAATVLITGGGVGAAGAPITGGGGVAAAAAGGGSSGRRGARSGRGRRSGLPSAALG